ncbi:MAG TPA: hypothetical protein VGN07_01550 [Steroidobacteraceae bacterium]|jgi:hypothetical protein
MNLARFMVSQNVAKGKAFLVYSSHRTVEKAFSHLDKMRRQRRGRRLYVRDKWMGVRVKRPRMGRVI